jgi:hypothetical protein
MVLQGVASTNSKVKRFLLHIKVWNEMDAQIIAGDKKIRNNETWIVLLLGW